MHQVNFSEQSMGELKKLDKLEQLQLIEQFSSLTPDMLRKNNEEVGNFERDGKRFYRIKFSQFRLYFEKQEEAYFVHYILHQHTISDFVFRFKLPVSEEWMVEQHQSFWNYLETLKK
ncbi:MAG: cytotoxic translational repressor of toxin-antitoxin stability system [Verrucomicrobia bacterium GWC2_42_7]|nr:MAG: cytotoxic translational repressor of toxin-antitoxin stability system [Verrucomicrobia bacterium GWC2_42_7]